MLRAPCSARALLEVVEARTAEAQRLELGELSAQQELAAATRSWHDRVVARDERPPRAPPPLQGRKIYEAKTHAPTSYLGICSA